MYTGVLPSSDQNALNLDYYGYIEADKWDVYRNNLLDIKIATHIPDIDEILKIENLLFFTFSVCISSSKYDIRISVSYYNVVFKEV